MVIVENRTTQEGDVLYLQTDIPALGVSALISFTDDTVGEGGSTYYKKTYQISKDGVTWGEWKDLTIANIQAEDVSIYDKLFIRYRYQHIGDGILEFNSNILTADYEDLECPYYFNDSIFKKYFSCNDIEVIRWYLNVTEKLYTSELNRYIKFDDGNGDTSHAMFFWQSVAKFFAFYVILARVYKNFYLREDLLNSYLIQRGLFTSAFNVLTELQDLMKNFNHEMFNRASHNILNRKSDGNLFDGELLRYLNVRDGDEFVFNYFLPYHCGWWVDRASPMYRGLEEHMNANKLKYERYILSGSATATVSPTDKNDVKITVNGSGRLGYDNSSVDKLIPINIKNNYIFEFFIKVSANTTITIGAECFDGNGDLVSAATTNFGDDTPSDVFIENLSLNRFVPLDVWVPIKCIIYNIGKPSPFSQDWLNLKVGNNLKFINNNDITKIYPFLEVTGNAEIKDVYFRQLSTEYERGFISMNHFVSILYDFDKASESQQNGFQYTLNFNL